MILVHEGGHFFAAKACGVRVLEFALGLGPKLIGRKIGETEYAIRLLPFGGMCAMEGEDEDSADPRAFTNAAPWKRLIILVSGVAMNFVMGLIILLCLFAPAKQIVVPVIDGFMEHYTGGDAILPGDRILSIDGYRVLLSSDISAGFAAGDDADFDIKVIRDGKRLTVRHVHVEPQLYEADGESAYYYGVYLRAEDATFGLKLDTACKESADLVRLVYRSLLQLFSGKVSLDDMAGPIGISATMSEVAQESMASFWYLTALIAINLAVMNLLPIPALDGGRVVFVLFEMITRHRPNRKAEAWIHGIGLLLLLALMAVIAFHDIWKLIF